MRKALTTDQLEVTGSVADAWKKIRGGVELLEKTLAELTDPEQMELFDVDPEATDEAVMLICDRGRELLQVMKQRYAAYAKTPHALTG